MNFQKRQRLNPRLGQRISRAAVFLSVLTHSCAPVSWTTSLEQKTTPNIVIFSEVRGFHFGQARSIDVLDPLFQKQWYFLNSGQISSSGLVGLPGADIQIESSNEIPEPKRDVIVAVIDTGLDLSHEDFDVSKLQLNDGETGQDLQGRDKRTNGVDDDGNGFVDDVLGWSFANNSSDVSDSLGHGTHVAGLLLGKSGNPTGIATPWKGIKILPVQIFSSQRPSPDARTVANAILYAVNRGARVISASFGTSSYSEEIKQAIIYARQHDVVVVSAVGNFRRNQDREPSYPAGFHLENQISVAASERRDLAANFSNYGSQIDLFAPGDDILSTAPHNSYVFRSGTSQACPLVAGAVALARAMNPQATALEIKDLVLSSADEKKGLQSFSLTGRRLNISNILKRKIGLREPLKDDSCWQIYPISLASEHPYRSNLRLTFPVEAPLGSRKFRLHFDKFSTQSTDMLEIRDGKGHVVTLLSGELGEVWSPVVETPWANLFFFTDQFVSDFGWSIDKIAFLTNESSAKCGSRDD